MGKQIIGVEIGNYGLKMAEMNGFHLLHFVSEPLPDNMMKDGEVQSWDGLADFIKRTAKENHMTTKEISLVIPDEACYIRRLTMPVMSAQQLSVNIPFEFHDFIGDDRNGYYFDYSMVGMLTDGESDEPTEMDLIAVAVSKALIMQYSEMFRAAEMKLVCCAPHSFAFQQLFRNGIRSEAGHDFAILDVGETGVNVNIYTRGIYDVTRQIDVGCRQLRATIADQLAVDPHVAEIYMEKNTKNCLDLEDCHNIYSNIAIEVMRAVNYYNFNAKDNNLENMYYCGGGAAIKQLIKEIDDTVPLNMIPLSSFAAPNSQEATALLVGPMAVGMAFNI